MTRKFSPFLKNGLAFVLVMVLPTLISLTVLDQILLEEELGRARETEARLKTSIQEVLHASQPRQVFQRGFQALFQYLETRGFSSEAIQNLPNVFPSFFPVQAAAFSSVTEMAVPEWGAVLSRYVVKQLWHDLVKDGWDARRVEIYRNLLGGELILGDLRNSRGSCFNIGAGANDGLIIWRARNASGAGLLALVPQLPGIWDCLSGSLRSWDPDGFFGAYSPNSRKFVSGGACEFSWKEVLQKGILQAGGTFQVGHSLVRVEQHLGEIWILRSLPLVLGFLPIFRFVLWLVGFGVLVIGTRFWFKRGLPPLAGYSIAPRILGLLLLTVLVPALLLTSLGAGSLRERTIVLELAQFERDVNYLREADTKFRLQREEVEVFFAKIWNDPDVMALNMDVVKKKWDKWRKVRKMGHLEIRDGNARVLFCDNPGSNFLKMLEVLAKCVLRRFLQYPIPESSDPMEVIARELLMSGSIGLTTVFDHPGKAVPMAMGRKDVLMYWNVRKPSPGKPLTFLLTSQQMEWELQTFLKKGLPKGVFSYDRSLGSWFPKRPVWPEADLLAAQVLLGRGAARMEVREKGRPMLASAYPSSLLKDVAFLTISDLSAIRSEITFIRKLLGLSAGLTLLLVFLFSRILAGNILRPISELASGVQALERKELSYRIPHLGNDELGSLGVAFNTMLEEMREVNMAREIQNSLIPPRSPDVAGYDIALRYHPASDLGGDYADVLPMSEDRVALIIGDVTGHGIGAALLTAMAKTICAVSAGEGKPIVVFFDRLNQLIHQVLKRKKLMTMAGAVLNSRTHAFEWATAGHPYPMWCLSDGTVGEWKMPGQPLGAKTRTSFGSETFSLEVNGMILFYTDGIVEALNTQGNMFGYVRLKEAFVQALGKTASETLDFILNRFQQFIGTVPPGDDVTLLLVRRLPH